MSERRPARLIPLRAATLLLAFAVLAGGQDTNPRAAALADEVAAKKALTLGDYRALEDERARALDARLDRIEKALEKIAARLER